MPYIEWSEAKHLSKEVWGIVWPVTFNLTCTFMVRFIMLSYAGHTISTTAMAALSASIMFINISGWSIAIGLGAAMDTLCSQEFGRDNKSPLVGVFFLRGVLVNCMVCVPVSVLWWNGHWVMRIISDEIADLAGPFIRAALVDLFPLVMGDALKHFLQAQGLVRIIALGSIAQLVSAPFAFYFFMTFLDWGLVGAGFGLAVTDWVLFIVLALYVKYGGACTHTWTGWSPEATQNIPKYLKLSVPSFFALASDWWAWEFITVMAGWISATSVAANGVLFTLLGLLWMPLVGIRTGVAVKVGNYMGATNPTQAKKMLVLGCICSIVYYAVGPVVVFGFGRHHVTYLLVNDDEVSRLVATTSVFLLAVNVGNAVNLNFGACMIGLGKQLVTSAFQLVSYWVIGLPIGYYCAFHLNQGYPGLWTGMGIAIYCAVIPHFFYLKFKNWEKLAADSQTQLASHSSNDLGTLVKKVASHEMIPQDCEDPDPDDDPPVPENGKTKD